MSSFAYSVAIKLTVANLASQGIRMLGADLMAAHGRAVALGDKLKALKMVAIGYGMERAGQGVLGFMEKSVDASKEYTRQLALMNAAGMTHAEIAGSVASAWRTSRDVITTTAADNLKAIRELRSVFGAGEGMQHAYAVLPTVQRAQAIMESLTGKKQEGVAFDMVKAIEFATKGAPSVASLTGQAEMMTKALMAFNGTLTVSDFHQTLKASKSAAPYLSDAFKYTILPTIMQEMKSGHGGAQAAGTAIATLFGTIKGHAIQTRMIPAWQDAGLIAKGGVVVDPHHKGMSRIGPGGIIGENLFTNNPLTWGQQILKPAIDRLMKTKHLDEIGAYYSLTGNRNSAFLMQTLVNKGIQFARDQQLIANVGGSYGVYQKLLKTDPQLADQALHAQMQNSLAIIGYQILPVLVPYMVRFANALGGIAQFFQAHPVVASAAAWGGLATGAGLVVGGKALMTAGIMKYLGINPGSMISGAASGGMSMLTTGLRILGTVFMTVGRALFLNPIGLIILGVAAAAYVLYRNWKTVGPYVMEVWSIIKAAFHVSMSYIGGKAKAMWGTVGPYVKQAWSIMTAFGRTVATTFNWLANIVTGALGRITSWIAGSWIGKAIGFVGGAIGGAAHGIGSALAGDFREAYRWSQQVNGQYEGSPYVRQGRSVHVTLHHVTKIGGRKVAEETVKHMVRDGAGPNRGGTGFNASMAPLRVATPR